MVQIEISEELKQYLDECLLKDGAEAWYTARIAIPLNDYDFMIKTIVNDAIIWRDLSIHDEETELPFKNLIKEEWKKS